MAERPGLLIPSPVPSGIAPPGPLMIRGGGAIGVSTDAMLAVGARLGTLAEVLGGLQRRVADAPRAVGAGVLLVAGDAWLGPAGELDFRRERLAALLRATADAARDLRERLRRAALDYQRAEESLRWLEQAQAARIGYGVGRALPLLLIVALELAGVAWVAWQLTPGSDAAKKEALRRFLVAHPELVTSPQFVSFVRGFSSSLDDALLGAAGMPWPVAWVLGGNGSGTGVEVGGTAILGLGGAIGLFQESDVRVRRVPDQITRTGPPATLRERLDRVPANPPDDPATPADESAQRGPHVRIERYDAPGATPRWIVYVDPTETFSPARSVEPWDLTSNVDGVAGRTAASFAATEAAMKDAGVAPSDPVQFVGFSQGGLVAGMLAGSGRWNAAGLASIHR